jgi:hypothetical protein
MLQEDGMFSLEGGGALEAAGAGVAAPAPVKTNSRGMPGPVLLPPLPPSPAELEEDNEFSLPQGVVQGDVESPLPASRPAVQQNSLFGKELQSAQNCLAIRFLDGSLYAGEWALVNGGRVGMSGRGVFEWSDEVSPRASSSTSLPPLLLSLRLCLPPSSSLFLLHSLLSSLPPQ